MKHADGKLMLRVKCNSIISRAEVTWIELLAARFNCIGSCTCRYWAFSFHKRVESLYRVHYYQTAKDGHALSVAAMRCTLGTDIGLVTFMAVARFAATVELFEANRLPAPPV